MRKILLAATAAIALVCPTPARADNMIQPTAIAGPLTINAQCSTPVPSGCSTGQFVSVKLGGRNSVVVQTVNSGLTTSWSAYVSSDGGATWAGAVPHRSSLSS